MERKLYDDSNAVEWNDVVKHANCVRRGHDFRSKSTLTPDVFHCKCGATARIDGNRLVVNNGHPKTKGEKRAERAARKSAWESSQRNQGS